MTREEFDSNNDDAIVWEISRKQFLRSLLLIGAATQIPFLNACKQNPDIEDVDFDFSPLTFEQIQTVRKIQLILFPETGNGPSALTVNADKYLVWVLNDVRLDKRENDYIIEKLDRFMGLSHEKYNSKFLDLSGDQQEDLIAFVAKEKWGEIWISRLLTLIFEALLLDPIYGGNPEGIAWEWLRHNPGTPRPDKNTSYPQILQKKHEI